VSLATAFDIHLAGDRVWDALVIGAGPAGSLTARQLALQGFSTLLVEAKPFPRFKVCGGCLSQRALDALEALGLGKLVADSGSIPLGELRLIVGPRQIAIRLPGGAVLSRQSLDQAIVAEAVQAGVCFLPETAATVEPQIAESLRRVTLRQQTVTGTLRAKVVICADGIGRSSIRQLPELTPSVAHASRIGVGAVLENDQLSAVARERFAPGRVVMHVGSGGYVGGARAEQGKTIIAAALDASFIKQQRSPAAAVTAILAATRLGSLGDISKVHWQGTSALTSHSRRVAAERLFVIGDSAGYVEPFTGEGMAWAFDSALAAAPLVAQACERWTPALADAWEASYRSRIRRQQYTCRALAALLRRPWAVSLAVGLVRNYPALADRIIGRLNPSRGGALA